jgi:hypothetical protein
VTLDEKINKIGHDNEQRIGAETQMVKDEIGPLRRTVTSLCDQLTSMAEQRFEVRCKEEKGKYDFNVHVCIDQNGISEPLPKVCPEDLHQR